MDHTTLSYVLAISYIVSFVAFLVVWLNASRESGLKEWLISAIFSVLAFVSIFFKPWIGNGTVVINNTAVIIALLFVLEGTLIFKKLTLFQKRYIVYILIVAYTLILAIITRDNPELRYTFFDPIMIMINIAIISIFLRKLQKHKIIFIGLSLAILVLILGASLRWYYAFTGSISTYHGIHPVVAIVYFTAFIWSYSWTIGMLVVMMTEANGKLDYLASRDALTGCLNRRSFEFDLDIIDKEAHSSLLTIIDVDRFKKTNDDYGHVIGDHVLIEISKRLNEFFDTSQVYRIGGDEFAMISKNISSEEVTQILKVLVVEKINISEQQIQIEISHGSALFDTDIPSQEVYKKADNKMYLRKKEKDRKKKSDN